MYFIKDVELAGLSDEVVNEKADPWELPEFTHTTIPWRGIECFYYYSFILST